MKAAAKKSYAKKGEDVVARNYAAIDAGANAIVEINYPESWATTTEGGPNRATEVMVYRIVSEAFEGLNYSGASAQSLVLIGLIMVFTFIQFRFVERQVHYK